MWSNWNAIFKQNHLKISLQYHNSIFIYLFKINDRRTRPEPSPDGEGHLNILTKTDEIFHSMSEWWCDLRRMQLRLIYTVKRAFDDGTVNQKTVKQLEDRDCLLLQDPPPALATSSLSSPTERTMLVVDHACRCRQEVSHYASYWVLVVGLM